MRLNIALCFVKRDQRWRRRVGMGKSNICIMDWRQHRAGSSSAYSNNVLPRPAVLLATPLTACTAEGELA